jgi:hypothetical protein
MIAFTASRGDAVCAHSRIASFNFNVPRKVADLTPVVKTCSFNKSFDKEVKVDSTLDGDYWKAPSGPRIRRAPARLHNSVE